MNEISLIDSFIELLLPFKNEVCAVDNCITHLIEAKNAYYTTNHFDSLCEYTEELIVALPFEIEEEATSQQLCTIVLNDMFDSSYECYMSEEYEEARKTAENIIKVW